MSINEQTVAVLMFFGRSVLWWLRVPCVSGGGGSKTAPSCSSSPFPTRGVPTDAEERNQLDGLDWSGLVVWIGALDW